MKPINADIGWTPLTNEEFLERVALTIQGNAKFLQKMFVRNAHQRRPQ